MKNIFQDTTTETLTAATLDKLQRHRSIGQHIKKIQASDKAADDGFGYSVAVSNSRIIVVLFNKPGSLGKVTTVIAKNNGNISNILFSVRKPDFFEIIIDIEVRDANHLQNIIAALRMEKEVSSLERLKG